MARSPRIAHKALLSALCLLLLAGEAGTVQARPRTRADTTTPTVQFGAYPRPRKNPSTGVMETQRQATLNLETEIGRQLAVIRVFYNWNSPFPDSFTNWLKTSGREAAISVKCKTGNGTAITWSSVASAIANHDPNNSIYKQALAWATEVKNYGVPIYFIYNHEPEAKASSACGTAPQYIDAWRAMYGLFQQQGATNAIWVWTMTDYSFELPSTDARYAAYWYPGDAYVDDIAADVYNWFDCRSKNGGPKNAWKTLESITVDASGLGGVTTFTDNLNQTLISEGQPPKGEILMEWGSVEDTTTPDPSRKPTWIGQVQSDLKGSKWSYLKAILYFHTQDGTYPACKWWADSTPASLSAFKTMANDPYYGA